MREPLFFTDAQRAEHVRGYEDMLVERYRTGLPLSAADLKEAERLILCNEGIARKTARIRRNRAKTEE